MTVAYQPQMAALLGAMSVLAYDQYSKGLLDPNYDGTVDLSGYPYRQTASFKAPELGMQRDQLPLSTAEMSPEEITEHISDPENRERLAIGIKRVYIGFAAEATDGSGNGIIALRGTSNPYEWVSDALIIQVPTPTLFFSEKMKGTKVHLGFLLLYLFLEEQIKAAVRKWSNPKVCYVTGHSLGGALAVLGALHTGAHVLPGKAQMYNFAGPRVGDSAFASGYNQIVPGSYRVVNLSDVVPIIPPIKIMGYSYQHVGASDAEWSFLNQTGDLVENHSMQQTYLPAVKADGIVSNAWRNYPISAVK